MIRWAARLSHPLLPAALSSLPGTIRDYLYQDVYEFRSPQPSLEYYPKVMDLIDEVRLSPLFITTRSEVDDKEMYLLQNLLRHLVSRFFRVDVDAFFLYRLQGFMRFVPLTPSGQYVYSSGEKLSYFLYHVQIDNLLGFYYAGEGKPRAGLYSLFGVLFTPEEDQAIALSLETGNLRTNKEFALDLPRDDLLREIGESFRMNRSGGMFGGISLRKGRFWTELGKEWMEAAWKEILLSGLPLAHVYYSPEYTGGSDSRWRYILTLAVHLASGTGYATHDSVSFPVSSLEGLKKALEKLKNMEEDFPQWTVVASPPGKTLTLQVAFEMKYPHSHTLGVDGRVVADTPEPPEFTDDEIAEAERLVLQGRLPKIMQHPQPPPPEIPPLQDKDGEAYVEVGGKYFRLGVSFKGLSSLWSAAILSPWVKARLGQNLWSAFWFR